MRRIYDHRCAQGGKSGFFWILIQKNPKKSLKSEKIRKNPKKSEKSKKIRKNPKKSKKIRKNPKNPEKSEKILNEHITMETKTDH
jgi:hypothetical protein